MIELIELEMALWRRYTVNDLVITSKRARVMYFELKGRSEQQKYKCKLFRENAVCGFSSAVVNPPSDFPQFIHVKYEICSVYTILHRIG